MPSNGHVSPTATSSASSTCSPRTSRPCANCRGRFSGDLDPVIAELEQRVAEGFVGCNLNPDPSGGNWSAPPIYDTWWDPLWEAMAALDVPAMIHVSGSCERCLHTTGAHYINADTAVFMQLIQGDLFGRHPKLRLIIPHGGGAAPYHWGALSRTVDHA